MPDGVTVSGPEVERSAEILTDDALEFVAELHRRFAATRDVTSSGVRSNVSVGVRHLAAWLSGNGAAAIDKLMEDAATAEIAPSQIWRWVHAGTVLADTGAKVTAELVQSHIDELVSADRELAEAAKLFVRVALDEDFATFLTLPAYELID
jgi:malate synthase